MKAPFYNHKMVKIRKNNEDKIHMTSDGILIVNGVEYVEFRVISKKIDGIEHTDKTTYKKFDRKEFNKKVKFIADKIEFTLDKKELVKELVKKQAINEINKLYDLLKENKKSIIKKQEGCIGIKIGSGKPKTGGRYIQLIE